MADQNFDFNELKGLKLAQYKKTHLKPAVFKKCKGAIIFVDYKLAGKKTPCVIVPFKKGAIAAKTFKDVKKNKEHLLKKTGLAALEFGMDAEGKAQVKIELKKGGLSAEMLKTKAAKLFGEIKMAFEVVGSAEAGGAEEQSEGTEEQNEGAETSNEGTENAAPTAQEVANSIKGMIKSVSDAMKNQISPVVANVKGKSVTEDDKNILEDVLGTIDDLKEAFESAEDRIKQALQAHYDKIMAQKPKLDKIKQAAEKLWDQLKDAVTGGDDKEDNQTDNAQPQNDGVFGKLLKKAEKVLKKAEKTVEKAKPKEARKARVDVQDFLGNLENLVDSVSESLAKTGKELIEKMNKVVEDLTNAEVDNTSVDDMVGKEQPNLLQDLRDNHL